MSNRYKGGVISATPPTTTGGEDGTASGAWTLEQQMQLQAAGLWPAQPTGPYIEQVFSTYLYTGNGSTQTITNGIDLSTKGGLVWSKCRSSDLGGNGIHTLIDTVRGAGYRISSELTGAQVYNDNTVTGFSSTGFSIGNSPINNTSSATFVSWTFREQAKFFDIVTFSQASGSTTTFNHNLGSTPGCMLIKTTGVNNFWLVYHTSLGNDQYIILNSTGAAQSYVGGFSVNSTSVTINNALLAATGNAFVAYLFAHNAGGFGLTGTDNVISCGSFDANNGEVINLGYEPQWLFYKDTVSADNWRIADTMRGLTNLSGTNAYTIQQLMPNSTAVESANSGPVLTSTGFTWNQSGGGNKHIYIAIRRGPMKVPTSGTSVFTPVARSGTGSTSTVSNSITTDLIISMTRNTAGIDSGVWDRLRGVTKYLATTGTAAESTSSDSVTALNNNSYVIGADTATDRINRSGYTYANWTFRRAPSFFDEVCYTGTGSTRTVTHNLGVAPELVIVKIRSSAGDNWFVLNTSGTARLLRLNSSAEDSGGVETVFGNGSVYIAPTSTNFTVGGFGAVNQSGSTFVAYLFATCAGVSKVGSYTGTGALQTVNCGFAAGARFVLIKRTDSTGDWFVWDSARGISSGNDPYLLLNSAAAEVTGTNYVDTTAVGFQVTAAAPAGLNANGGTFIFLAIA